MTCVEYEYRPLAWAFVVCRLPAFPVVGESDGEEVELSGVFDGDGGDGLGLFGGEQ